MNCGTVYQKHQSGLKTGVVGPGLKIGEVVGFKSSTDGT